LVAIGVGTGIFPNPETLSASRTIPVDCPTTDVFVERPEDAFLGDLVCDAVDELYPLFDGDPPTVVIRDTSGLSGKDRLLAARYLVIPDVVQLPNRWLPGESEEANQQIAVHELAHKALTSVVPLEERANFALDNVTRLDEADARIAMTSLFTAYLGIVDHDSVIVNEPALGLSDDVMLEGTVWQVFTESTYMGESFETAGHPWSNPGELFASVVSISHTYPEEMYENIRQLSPERQGIANVVLSAVRAVLEIHGKASLVDELIPTAD